MEKINTFKDLKIWKLAFEIALDVYKFSNNSILVKDFALKDQIQRSSISIPSNIAEGFDRKSNKEFIRFLYISKGSASELRTQLELCLNLEKINIRDFQLIDSNLIEVSK